MHGALAWVTGDGHLVAVEDLPIIEVRGKNRVSSAGLAVMMAMRPVSIVVIEGVGAMPRRGKDGTEIKQGAASSFAFGYGAGIIEGVAAGSALPLEIVWAATWKRKAGVPKDKGASRQMASRIWPGVASRFARVKDDGRAEAALLARWYALQGAPLNIKPDAVFVRGAGDMDLDAREAAIMRETI